MTTYQWWVPLVYGFVMAIYGGICVSEMRWWPGKFIAFLVFLCIGAPILHFGKV